MFYGSSFFRIGYLFLVLLAWLPIAHFLWHQTIQAKAEPDLLNPAEISSKAGDDNQSLSRTSSGLDLLAEDTMTNQIRTSLADDAGTPTIQREEPALQEVSESILKNFVVDPEDFIYKYQTKKWDSAPIVIKKYKLVFFAVPKVACTTFKRLFRRMMGYKNFMSQNLRMGLPHNPARNGLLYLWNYTLEEANHMMTSPEYTRAIFVRDPKARFMSAYLDKGVANYQNFLVPKCCPATEDCYGSGGQTAMSFLRLIQNCSNTHWEPQNHRMEEKYWKYINFVGHLESIQDDGPRLLERIGANEYINQGGWGKGPDAKIFQRKAKQTHLTNASSKLSTMYTPELESRVEEFYAEDYDNEVFHFKKTYYSRTA